MPDSLILEIPAHPAISTDTWVPSASMPAIPFNTSDLLVRLYREALAAADALEGVEEADDGPLHKGYHSATDRFMDAPINTMGDVLLKLDHIAYHEDLEARPHPIINRTLLALLRDLRATDAAQRQLSKIEAARQPAPPTNRIATLRSEVTAAEQRLEVSHEEDDGPLARAFFEVQDRLTAEPVRTNEDVIQKLEYLAQHELLDDPQTIPAQVVANLLRDFRSAAALAPALDVLAIHRAADEQVDKIYCLQGRMTRGLEALRHLGKSVCSADDWLKLRFIIDSMSDTNDDLLTANDAIDPLNPTVLDEQVE